MRILKLEQLSSINQLNNTINDFKRNGRSFLQITYRIAHFMKNGLNKAMHLFLHSTMEYI